jgi:serpin B
MNKLISYILLFSVSIWIISCDSASDKPEPGYTKPFKTLMSDKARDLNPDVTDAEFSELIAGNTNFSIDLYNQYKSGSENIFYSPLSISLALAMTYAGAKGNTATQMAEVLHFTLLPDKVHHAFNKLDLALSELGNNSKNDEFTLNIENSTWGEKTYSFLDGYLDILSINYGAGIHLLDFINSPDDSRIMINDWVEHQTKNKIKNLLPAGSIDSAVRFVLTNAIYFLADWHNQFEKKDTFQGAFYLLSGSSVNVSLMKQINDFSYYDGDGYQAIELPYKGNEADMLIIVPDLDNFANVEQNFSIEILNTIDDNLAEKSVELTMPKWKFKSNYQMKETLIALGMTDAFSTADFSGIDGTLNLVISDVFHKAFIAVDEEGTEAAAATAVVLKETSIEDSDVTLKIDRPFIFMIRDTNTKSIIFKGRILEPTQ